MAVAGPLGVDARALRTPVLLHYIRHLHRTRQDALRHAPTRALVTHLARTGELEVEYLRRFPAREAPTPPARRS
jgi:hypothetical protein